MRLFYLLIIAITLIIGLFFLCSYFCYRFAFYVPKRKIKQEDMDLPEGAIYEQFHDQMRQWVREVRQMEHENVSITSFDGLKLCGRFYEFAPGAPIELMFHGYRGNGLRDLSGGVQRSFALGRSALIVEQRGSLESGGHVISMGIHEYRDCLAWIDFAVEHFGADVKIILTGISMGASTVLMAAGQELPENVIGVLADCGYHSPKEIMIHVMKDLGLPSRICYPFVKWGARIFGRFDLEEYSPLEAMRTCKVPVFFIHGEDDAYVPSFMSKINYEACTSRKRLVLIPGAGHGLSYPVAPEHYISELRDFFGTDASYQAEKI